MTSTTTGRLVDGEATRELRESYATVVSSNRDSVRASWRFGQRIDSYSDQYTRAQLAEALQLSVGTLGRYLRLYRTYQRPELAEDAARQLETYNIDLIVEMARPVHARPTTGRRYRYRCTSCSSTEIARVEVTDPAELAELDRLERAVAE